jgi:AcrR family transcriptional regulator
MSTDLPSGVALTWGVRPQRRPGPRPSMTLEQITAAAVEVADDGGLDALSMASVAQRLGCTKMALYRYVEGKDDLQALMLDAAVGPPPGATSPEGWARALLDRYLARPWALDVPVGSTAMTRNQALWLESVLRALRPSGLTLPQRLSVALLLSTHVAATARFRRDRRRAAGAPADAPPVEVLAAAGLEDVLAAFAEGHLADPDGEEHEFAFGVRCILDGAGAVAARAPGPAPSPDQDAHPRDGGHHDEQ